MVQDKAKATAMATFEETSELETGTATIEDLIETSPFQNIGDPLLMPFLVFKAKSKDGRGFQRCGIQTALPLWVLLNYQLQLQNQAGPLSEQGGPLVWYIAYRGDSWRVFWILHCHPGKSNDICKQMFI
jgi:hypothetical protein